MIRKFIGIANGVTYVTWAFECQNKAIDMYVDDYRTLPSWSMWLERSSPIACDDEGWPSCGAAFIQGMPAYINYSFVTISLLIAPPQTPLC